MAIRREVLPETMTALSHRSRSNGSAQAGQNRRFSLVAQGGGQDHQQTNESKRLHPQTPYVGLGRGSGPWGTSSLPSLRTARRVVLSKIKDFDHPPMANHPQGWQRGLRRL